MLVPSLHRESTHFLIVYNKKEHGKTQKQVWSDIRMVLPKNSVRISIRLYNSTRHTSIPFFTEQCCSQNLTTYSWHKGIIYKDQQIILCRMGLLVFQDSMSGLHTAIPTQVSFLNIFGSYFFILLDQKRERIEITFLTWEFL